MNTHDTLTVRELYDALDRLIPRSLSLAGDNDGLMVCPDPGAPVEGILFALDATEDVVRAAAERGCNVIISHHPMIFRGVKAVDGHDTVTRKIVTLAKENIAVMSFHTRLDTVAGGVNDVLAHTLGLQDVTPFGDASNEAHAPIGRVGNLAEPMTLAEFVRRVKDVLDAPSVAYADAGRPVHRVAVLGGAGDDDVSLAALTGADTYVTGELRYHNLCDAPYGSVNLIAAGHYHTEIPVHASVTDMIRRVYGDAGKPCPKVEVLPACNIQYV